MRNMERKQKRKGNLSHSDQNIMRNKKKSLSFWKVLLISKLSSLTVKVLIYYKNIFIFIEALKGNSATTLI